MVLVDEERVETFASLRSEMNNLTVYCWSGKTSSHIKVCRMLGDETDRSVKCGGDQAGDIARRSSYSKRVRLDWLKARK
jgi:hypothetical protein